MTKIKKRRIAAALLALLIVASGAAAYTVVFSAGGGTTYEAPSGLVVSTDTTHVMDDANPFNGTDTVYIAGVSFTASSPSELTASQFQGSTTHVRAIDTNGTTITVDPDDKSAVNISGAVTKLEWEDAALDGTAQITYSASGSGTIVATGLPANTDYAAATDGGTVLTTGTTTSSGEASISVTSASNEQIVLLEPTAAEASNLAPNGSETNNENVELSFDLADQDFATDAGDSVDVDLVVDGTTANSWAGVSSNQSLNYTVQGLGDGDHDWHVEMTDSYGGTSTSATATFTVNHYAPEFNEASADPADGAKLTEREQTFQIDISDIDFAEPSGDTVTATLYIDGSEIGTDTLTSNGTVNVTTTILKGGSHDYYWIATDEYGNSTTSTTRSISAPSELRIYNESAPTQLVDNATVELRMYTNETGDSQVYSRNSSDGSINMTGIPADQPFIVVADADGYLPRRIFVSSLYESQTIYLLPETDEYVDTTFAIEDYSGEFPQDETVLIVQRELNGTFQTVLGDYFGANSEFPAQLAFNQRHRLILHNVQTGKERPLGTFTPIATGPQTITVSPSGEIQVDETQPTISFPEMSRLPAKPSVPFEITIAENDKAISNWSATIEYADSSTTTVLYDATSSPDDSHSATLDLEDRDNGTVTAIVEYTLEDGTTRTVSKTYVVQAFLKNDNSLLASLTAFVDLAPSSNQDSMTTFLAMFLTVFATAGIVWKVPMPTEMVGITAWGVLAVFGVLGWVPYQMLFVSGVAAASFAYLGGIR